MSLQIAPFSFMAKLVYNNCFLATCVNFSLKIGTNKTRPTRNKYHVDFPYGYY